MSDNNEGFEEFVILYSKISEVGTEGVRTLLSVQDKTDTKYSRVKTCLELWNHLTEKHAKEFYKVHERKNRKPIEVLK